MSAAAREAERSIREKTEAIEKAQRVLQMFNESNDQTQSIVAKLEKERD